MTNEQAKKMLKAKLECLKRETSGTDFDCNNSNCDECSLCYEQGNMGEQKEALDMAIKALEQQPCEDAISRKAVLCHNENHDYAECDQFVCSNCGIELQDWHRVERDIDTGDITYHQYEFKYCPNCGAKIDKRTLKYADQDTMMSAT